MVILKKYIKNGSFLKFFSSKKSDPNIHQNAPICTIFKNFLGGTCPRTPLAKRIASPCAECRFATCKSPKNSWPPPLSNPIGTPLLADS